MWLVELVCFTCEIYSLQSDVLLSEFGAWIELSLSFLGGIPKGK